MPVLRKKIQKQYESVARGGDTLKIIVTFEHFPRNCKAGFRYTVKERVYTNFYISIVREDTFITARSEIKNSL